MISPSEGSLYPLGNKCISYCQRFFLFECAYDLWNSTNINILWSILKLDSTTCSMKGPECFNRCCYFWQWAFLVIILLILHLNCKWWKASHYQKLISLLNRRAMSVSTKVTEFILYELHVNLHTRCPYFTKITLGYIYILWKYINLFEFTVAKNCNLDLSGTF